MRIDPQNRIRTSVVQWAGLNNILFVTEVHTTKSGPGPEVIKLFSCSTQLSMKF